MQQQTSQDNIPTTLTKARERFRQIRRDLPSLFKRELYKPDIITSPFINNPDWWTAWSQGPPPSALHPEHQDSIVSPTNSIMDGAADKQVRKGPKAQKVSPHVSAVFVHAGAGYHSTTNEHIHLAACSDATRMAMHVLKAGGTAVDAVEAAIKILEDKEITNAGFGSNLSIDGVVEADATIVDHLGRSGACGATAQIKNPIHLARIILESSNKPLSLRRVPPNLLVGQGATDFAYESGIPIVPFDMLVSRNARDRYVRWREDLHRAEGRMTPGSSNSSHAGEVIDHEYEARVQAKQRRDHTNAILTGTWNEGQPDSPLPSPGACFQTTCSSYRRSPSPVTSPVDRTHLSSRSRSPVPFASKRPRYSSGPQSDSNIRTHSLLSPNAGTFDFKKSHPDVSTSLGETARAEHIRPGSSDGHMSPTYAIEKAQGHLSFAQEGTAESPSKMFQHDIDEDMITDTVGAIAIDMYGNIAAGSSSGGIGMKHRGRVGPAALVGIGTAVVPADQGDPEAVSVAAVTSGTGEHMATTMASQKCADRLYHNTRRGSGGTDIAATEEEAIESFVQADFMDHPGVSASSSMGAIGVMAVKKTAYGYFLYFAHNTDSFALASMHSNERDPKCVMSRLGDHGSVVQGGRKVRVN